MSCVSYLCIYVKFLTKQERKKSLNETDAFFEATDIFLSMFYCPGDVKYSQTMNYESFHLKRALNEVLSQPLV